MDPKLQLKPIELLDIGIDKLTKIPVPILNDNMVSTFDTDNGVPSDSFVLTFDANYSNKIFLTTITSRYLMNLSFDYGDGVTESWLITTGGTSITHTYASAITYTITATGWIEKITSLIILPASGTGGLTSASISKIKTLSYLNLTNNRLTKLSLVGLIYLNTITLTDNYFPNDVIDDLYIEADTFLTFSGKMDTTGTNNGKPSGYSLASRNSLTVNKWWTLSYNT